MAELVVGSIVQYATGSALAGQIAGWAIGAYLNKGNGQHTEGPRLQNLQVQSSTEGAPIPTVYGTSRIAGNVIWSAGIKETSHTQSSGGKGGPTNTSTTYTYSCSFAVGLCEGTITGIRRIWADGILIYNKGDTATADELSVSNAVGIAIYTGSETQEPDPTIEAFVGIGSVPGHRGLAYIVFTDLQLEKYGNRIPNITCEVVSYGYISPLTFKTRLQDNFYDYVHSIFEMPDGSIGAVINKKWDDTLPDGNYMYRSDTGVTWERVSENLDTTLSAGFCEIRVIDDKIYLGTYSRVYVSSNNGVSWSEITTSDLPFNTISNMSGMEVVPETQTIYASMNSSYYFGGHIYKYYYGFGGGVWEEVTDQSNKDRADPIMKLADGNIYWVDGAADVRRLIMPGETPELVKDFITGYTGYLYTNPSKTALYFTRGPQLYISRDYGASWLFIPVTNSTTSDFISSVVDTGKGTMYTVSSGGRIGQSDDNGVTWTEIYRINSTYGISAHSSVYTKNSLVVGSSYYSNIYQSEPPTVGSTDVPVSTVIQSISEASGVTVTDTVSVTKTLKGYVRTNPMTAQAALQPLLNAYSISASESDYQLKFSPLTGSVNDALDATDLGASASKEAEPLKITRGSQTELPRRVETVYIDPDGDYQQGNQFAQRVITEN